LAAQNKTKDFFAKKKIKTVLNAKIQPIMVLLSNYSPNTWN